jgi:regulatory protein
VSGRRRAPAAPRALDLRGARAVALDLLARKGWTRRELAARLARRGAPPDVAAAVVADLEARGYVDDPAFAAMWAEVRARGRAIGSRRLRDELGRKGVDRVVVDAAIRAAFADTDELTRARAAAGRRWPGLRRARPDQAARRLGAYLLRRGYPAGIVGRVVREICPATVGAGD